MSFSIHKYAILNIYSLHYLFLILLADMTNFRSLEILDMSGNMFTGILLPCIGTLSSLKAISLSQNKLHGNLHAKGKNLL